MVLSQAAALVERIIGHGDQATTEQDVTNPGRDREKYADPSGEMMKALVWMGKNTVEVREVPKPRVVESRDVILKVTGSTVCGSDLHLLHGTVIELEKGDILGHVCCFFPLSSSLFPNRKRLRHGSPGNMPLFNIC
jgi:hypothetical protein